MFGGLVARRLCLAILAGLALVGPTATATATPIITGLNRTGTQYPIGTPGGQDSFWEVYAFPTAYTGPITPGYQAWVFSGGAPVNNVPPTWYPGRFNGGEDNVGANGARWIGLQQDNAASLFPGNFTPPLSDYTVIYRTTFQSDSAGVADFSLLTAADNAISFFVGGTVDNADPFMPTMTGQQIGSEKQGLGFLSWVNGSATVVAGTNDFYAVVRDRFVIDTSNPNVGTYGQTGFLIAAVPEPSSIVLAAIGGGFLVIGAVRRRLKRLA
jgi:hypothetical protein